MSFGSVPTNSSSIPLGSVYTPNTANSDLTALEGGPISTDSNSQKSAPASMYVKDGANVTQGTSTDGNTANTVMGRLTKIRDVLLAGVAVTGTFWQSVQPVSGTFWQATQPVSATSLPLPTGASTAAKQPVLGTAGSASSDVLSVQGITSMTPLKTDNSGVTQPVSGTVTANAGTNMSTASLALETGGNLATLVTNTADLLADGDHLATIDTSTAASKTDLDTIVTNTNKIPASPAQEAGNLATLVTNTADLLADGDHLATIDSGIASLVTNTADLLADGDNLATIATNTTGLATDAHATTIATNTTTIAGAITSAKIQSNVTQIGGQTPTLDNTTIQAVSMRGKGAGTAGDTALLLDTSGRAQQVQILGSSVLSDTNPEPNISNIQQMMINGKAYSCSTGLITAAANQASSFFIPNTNAKNVIIWSVRVLYSNASQISDMRFITTDDTNITAGTSDAGNVINLKSGGTASASTFAMHHVSAATVPTASASTLPLDEIINAINATTECFAPGMFVYIPPSTASGIALYTNTTAAGKWQVVFRWVEY